MPPAPDQRTRVPPTCNMHKQRFTILNFTGWRIARPVADGDVTKVGHDTCTAGILYEIFEVGAGGLYKPV